MCFANDGPQEPAREAQSRAARMSHTSGTTMDSLFATWRLQIAKVDLAGEKEKEGAAPRITNNSRPRVILDLAWEVAGYLFLSRPRALSPFLPFGYFPRNESRNERNGDTRRHGLFKPARARILFYFFLPFSPSPFPLFSVFSFFFYSSAFSQSPAKVTAGYRAS